MPNDDWVDIAIDSALTAAFGPVGFVAGNAMGWLFDEGRQLFGSGDKPKLPPPPKVSPPVPPNGQGPAQDQIAKLNKSLADMQKQIEELHKAGQKAADESGNNSANGQAAHDQIYGENAGLQPGLTAQGSTPEADAGRLAAMQQQIEELTKNVRDKANNANGIADGLRNLGMGMPPMGMPGLGGGMMPGLGGGGLSPTGGAGLPTPAPVKALDGAKDPVKPTDLTKANEGLKPPPVTNLSAPPATPAAPTTGATPTGPKPAAAATTPPAAAAAPSNAQPPASPPASKDVTLPGGHVVTARSPQGAQAVRKAIDHPAGTGDVATTAYADTDVKIPTDGADIGRKVDPADVKPGDVAVFADHTALVVGNGQLVGADGKLQPLGVINDMPGFKGFFDPTATASTDVSGAVPVPATTPPAPGSTPAHPNTDTPAATPLGTPAGPAKSTSPASPKPSTNPGFGLPAQPAHDR